jgi:hypothetical protein
VGLWGDALLPRLGYMLHLLDQLEVPKIKVESRTHPLLIFQSDAEVGFHPSSGSKLPRRSGGDRTRPLKEIDFRIGGDLAVLNYRQAGHYELPLFHTGFFRMAISA